jgi:ubiquinone/menaquinone biosynthesis C-methylase UbiE
VSIVSPSVQDVLLDVATGTGHTALAFAPHVSEVTAYDLTEEMLQEAAKLAKERGLSNVTTRQGVAESMPFEDESFDIVTVRTAPHHFVSVASFIQESYRVLRPGGKFLVVDTTSPEDSTLADEINYVEKLRDPSHGRNLKPSEWTNQIEAAGFKVVLVREGKHAKGKKMEVRQWMDRIGTPEKVRKQIVQIFTSARPQLVEALEITERDGALWFTLPEVTVLATKPSSR